MIGLTREGAIACAYFHTICSKLPLLDIDSLVQLSSDIGAIDWIARSLHEFGKDVGSVILSDYSKYVRIMHPISLRSVEDHSRRSMRWSELAALRSQTLGSALRELADLRTPAFTVDGEAFSVDHSPVGSLTENLSKMLGRQLAMHTATPSSCYFALWEGWMTSLTLAAANLTRDINRRRYVLFHGRVDEAARSFEPDEYRFRSANLWWPEDRAWIVATDIDFHWTYVAGSAECIAQILRSDAFEAYPTRPSEPNLIGS